MLKRAFFYSAFILAWLGYMATDVHCASKHVRADGPQGAGDGSTYADAYGPSSINTAIGQIGCGEYVYLHGGTTYSFSINTSSSTGYIGHFDTTSCAQGNERTIRGTIVGTTTAADYDNMPILDGNYNYTAPASSASFVAFSAAVDINGIKFESIRAKEMRSFFMNGAHTTGVKNDVGRNDYVTFQDIYLDDMQEAIYFRGNGQCVGAYNTTSCSVAAADAASTGLTMTNVYINGVVKNGIRLQNGVQNSTFTNINVDCGGQAYNTWDGNPPTGINLGPAESTPERNLTFNGVTAGNCNGVVYPSSSGTYTQGDGFAAEHNASNITVNDFYFHDNTDGGYDGKTSVTLNTGLLIRNKRNIRFTGSVLGPATCNDCFIAWAKKPSGMTTGEGWANVHAFSNGNINNSTIYNLGGATAGGWQNFVEKSGGSVCSPAINVRVTDSVYILDSSSTASGNDSTNNNLETDCNLVLTNTQVYDNLGSVKTTPASPTGFGSVPETTTALSSEMNTSLCPGQGFCTTATTPGGTPPAPENLSCTASSSSQIDCTWDAPTLPEGVSAITGYLVDRETPTGNGFSTITTVTGEDLTNGTFEGSFTSGLGASWQEMNEAGSDITPSQETTIVYAGSNSQKVVASNFDDGVMQLITVANGTSCTSSVRVYVPTGTTSERIRCKTQEDGGDYTVYGSAAMPASTNDVWTLLSWDWTKGADGNQARNACYVGSGASGTFTFYMDNFSTVCGGVNTSYSHTGLSASTQYNTRVTSINAEGNGGSATNAATTSAASGTSDLASVKITGGATVRGGCSFKR